MPARQINLLPQDDFEKKPLGRLLIWALSIGKWIVIITESLVMLAFFSRFKLDQDITDLHDSIRAKDAIVTNYQGTENNFRLIQKKLIQVSDLEKKQFGAIPFFDEIIKITPLDVTFKKLSIDNHLVTITASSLTENGFGSLLNGLSSSSLFKNISVTNITKGTDSGGVQFSITAELRS